MDTMLRGAGRALVAVGLVVAGLAVGGCGAEPSDATPSDATPSDATLAPSTGGRQVLEASGAVDYQLGGAYRPAPGVTVVVRDSTAAPAGLGVDICYVNGFQTQPGERDDWLARRPSAVLRDQHGDPVVDPAWPDELVLDTRTPAARAIIADAIGPVIDRCAGRGFDAVEIDNLDTAERFETLDDSGNVALARTLVDRAHAAGLAVGQKNAAGLAGRGPAIGFDFAVSEQCAVFDECDVYRAVYGAQHIDVEYPDVEHSDVEHSDVEHADESGSGSFEELCGSGELPHLTVLRDEFLLPAGAPGHLERRCP